MVKNTDCIHNWCFLLDEIQLYISRHLTFKRLMLQLPPLLNNLLKYMSQKGFVANIEQLTQANNNFRQVLYTTPRSQLVLMSLQPKEDIGAEIHSDNDQFLRIESGSGRAVLNDIEHPISDGSAIVVPAGTKHNIINDGDVPMRMYTVYSPAHHRLDVVHPTKADAEADEGIEHFDGQISE